MGQRGSAIRDVTMKLGKRMVTEIPHIQKNLVDTRHNLRVFSNSPTIKKKCEITIDTTVHFRKKALYVEALSMGKILLETERN